MKDNDKELVFQLVFNRISEQEFSNKFTVDIKHNPDYIFEVLNSASIYKNEEDFEDAMIVACRFNLFSEKNVDFLCRLLAVEWHHKHEDIVRILQSIKSPNSIEYLFRTALTKFEYLQHDNSYSLARKCMWALGDINTDESIEKLRLLAESEDEEIKGYAIEQFNREKIKEKYNYNFNNI